jgi:hypothetical protein
MVKSSTDEAVAASLPAFLSQKANLAQNAKRCPDTARAPLFEPGGGGDMPSASSGFWYWSRSGDVEPVQFHHLGPGRDEVSDEACLAPGLGIDLGKGAKLRI